MHSFRSPSSLFKIITTATLCGAVACSSAAEDDAAPIGVGGSVSAAGTTSAGAQAVAGGGANTAGTAGTSTGEGGSGGTAQGGAGGVASAGSAGTAGTAGTGGGTANGFVHPGVLVNKGMLEFVKAKVTAGTEPWKSALDKAKNSNFGSLSYTPKPRATVECGPTSNPDVGCSDEKNDVVAAFTHALIWYHTRDKRYGDKAIQIMNAWSAVLKGHTNDNTQLQAAWCSEVFTRAAEIMRYSDAGWAEADIEKFESMLKTVYLPQVANGSTRTGNWDTSAIEAALNIAVFLDDKPQFDKAIALWRARTPAYIYLKTDGALPKQPPRENPRSDSALRSYWWAPTAFVDGITQESCRDRPGGGTPGFGHAQYGVAAIINAAETARIQGVDLFTEEKARLTAYLEFHSKYINGASVSNVCTTPIAAVKADPMWEIGYNAYANVLGTPLPQTLMLVQAIRPTGADHHMVWETLTHAGIGNAGL